MLKLNNKGFTLIELTLSFLTAFMMAFSMYDLLFGYRERQYEESLLSQMEDYSNQIQLAVQNDISERKLKLIVNVELPNEEKNKKVDSLGEKAERYAAILKFNDGTEKRLAVVEEMKYFEDTKNANKITYISYGGIKFESSEARLLEFKIKYFLYEYPDENVITYSYPDVANPSVDEVAFLKNTKIYKIAIPIYHNDLEGDHGFEIIAVGNDYIKPVVDHGSVDYVEASPANNKKVAIYSADDQSLTFVNLTSNLSVGDTYNSKKVTNIYIGFEKYTFSRTDIPWYAVRTDVKKVIFSTKVHPISTAHWFNGFHSATSIDVSNIDTTNVVDMKYMFYEAGMNANNFSLNLGDNFDTSGVTNMAWMFFRTGRNASTFSLDLGDKFDTSSVTDMEAMFWSTGLKVTNFKLDLGNKFNTSNVTNMKSMFRSSGYTSSSYTLKLGDKFDTSNVRDMTDMFRWTGKVNSTFELNLGNKFNTGNVTSMKGMFYETGKASTKLSINCTNWNIDKVTNHDDFNYGVGTKITAPDWEKSNK